MNSQDHNNNSNNESLKIAEEQMRLAAERTYLAWIRTGLASVGIGLAIARFVFFKKDFNQHTGMLIGQLLILWGIGVFIFALLSYQKNFRKLKMFKTEKYPLVPLTIITSALILFSVILFIINMD